MFASLAGGLLLVLSIISFTITHGHGTDTPLREQHPLEVQHEPLPGHLSPLASGLVLSATGYVLFVGLLLTVVTRPGWCPSWLCMPVQTYVAGSTHDADLELYWQTFESSAYTIPGDPASYTLATLPTLPALSGQKSSVGAVRIDQSPAPVYRVVVFAHSLLQSGYPIRIEQVNIQVAGVPDSPRPLRVTAGAVLRDYVSNPYRASYHGQEPGARLAAVYQGLPGGHVELVPRETDQLDIQITSNVPADVQFRVQVVYRVANESVEHTLTLGDTFTVIFSNATNWQMYVLQNGRLVEAH